MSVRALLLVGLTCLLLPCVGGCHRRNTKLDLYVDAMGAEYRALEDRYFDLQFDYERKVAELEKLRRRLDGQADAADDDSPPRAPQRSIPPADDFEIPDLSPPVIDPGTPRQPGLDSPDTPQLPDGEGGTGGEGDTGGEGGTGSESMPGEVAQRSGPNRRRAAGADTAGDAGETRVESIALNRSLTGGQDFDELPGDDGLTVVIEPLSDSGRILPRPGKVTVVALDPSQQGEAARVAKWTVERKRVESSLRGGPGRGGIYLKLGWPRRKPQHRRLHVFVRYETDDGRRLEADQEIEIAMAGELARRWTPRTRSRPAAQVARTPSAARQSDAEREGNASRPPAAASPSPPPEAPAWSPYR